MLSIIILKGKNWNCNQLHFTSYWHKSGSYRECMHKYTTPIHKYRPIAYTITWICRPTGTYPDVGLHVHIQLSSDVVFVD